MWFRLSSAVVILIVPLVRGHYNEALAFVIGNYTPAGAVEVYKDSDTLDLRTVGASAGCIYATVGLRPALVPHCCYFLWGAVRNY